MKTRFVKLLGLLTVLMVPAMLWLTWPYRHPIWWRDEPAIEDESMDSVLESHFRNEGEIVRAREVIGWSLYRKEDWSLSQNEVFEHVVIVRTEANSTYGVSLQLTESGWVINNLTRKNKHKTLFFDWWAWAFTENRIYPRAWKRVTGEVLTPSRLEELESGGGN